MKYEYPDGLCTFEVPDTISVRQQMRYYGAIGVFDSEYLLRWWEGAKTLIKDWHCELMPDINTDLDTVTDPRIADILTWSALRVREHLAKLSEIPKN